MFFFREKRLKDPGSCVTLLLSLMGRGSPPEVRALQPITVFAVLLVIGVSGALYIGISSLNGLAGLVCGAAARRGLQFKKKRGTQL